MDEATFKEQINTLLQEMDEGCTSYNLIAFLAPPINRRQYLYDGYRTSLYGLDIVSDITMTTSTTISREIIPWNLVLSVGLISRKPRST